MSLTLAWALFLQALAVAAMRWRLGRAWIRRPVSLLLIAAVIYNGISEMLLAIPSVRVWDVARIGMPTIHR